MTIVVEILAVPAQALIVDEGRHGWAHLAVTRAGAYDRRAFARANRLVGNVPGAATIEYVLGPVALRLRHAATLAICGVVADVQVHSPELADTHGQPSDPGRWNEPGPQPTPGQPDKPGQPHKPGPQPTPGRWNAPGPQPTPGRPHKPAPRQGPGRVDIQGPWDARARSASRGTEETITVPAGSVITIGPAAAGLRGYIALRGGIDAPATLGSRSADTLSGLGPAPLRAGDLLARGNEAADFPTAGVLAADTADHALHLRLLPAPRSHLLQLPLDEVSALRWTVSPDSNRVGLRLAGPAIAVDATPAAASEPLVRGAVQIPPDGQPVIMGPDHPTTGGYPVIGVVAARDSDALAQARPGDTVFLAPATY